MENPLKYAAKFSRRGILAARNVGDRLGSNHTWRPERGKGISPAFSGLPRGAQRRCSRRNLTLEAVKCWCCLYCCVLPNYRGGTPFVDKVDKPLDSWREELTDEQFHVCRLGGTERPFTGAYHDSKTPASTTAPAVVRRCSIRMPNMTLAAVGRATFSRSTTR